MNIRKTLQNPFALIAQGFVAGAILIWTTLPPEAPAPQLAQQVAAAIQA